MSVTRNKRQAIQPTRPGVVFDHQMTAGIDVMANAVKGTLGPTPRMVAVERMSRDRTPELMDDAGTLARRLLQLPDPTTDAGAMLLRHAMWRIRELHGDGAATLAMLAQAMAHEAVRARAAGGHPALLRQGVEAGAAAAIAALRAGATPVAGGARGRAMLRGIATALCQDEELRNALVEVIEVIGAEAGVQVMPHEGRDIVREFAEGAMWDGGWIVPGFARTPGKPLDRAEDVAVVAVHGKLDDAQSILNGLARIHAAGHSTVALIIDGLGDTGKDMLLQAHHRGLIRILPLRVTKTDAELMLAFQDICVLTGATLLYGEDGPAADAAFAAIEPWQIGKVRRIWADDKRFGLIGGTRDPQKVRAAIALVRRQLDSSAPTQSEQIQLLRARLGRLNGGLGILRVGAVTQQSAEQRRDDAIRHARALQSAMTSGVVAGGGAALLHCQPAVLDAANRSADPDIALGMRVLAAALAAPQRQILENATVSAPAVYIQRLLDAGSGAAYDVFAGRIVDAYDHGLLDAADVVAAILRSAVSGATMTLSTDAIVYHRKPQQSLTP